MVVTMKDPFTKLDANGDIIVRSAFIIVFFSSQPFPAVASSFGRTFLAWEKFVPDEAKSWVSVGASSSSYKRANAQALARCRAQFDTTKATEREFSHFELRGPEQWHPAYEFDFTGLRDPGQGEARASSYVQITLPTTHVGAEQLEQTLTFIREIAALLPYDSGYASLALAHGAESDETDFAEAVRGLIKRHPGLDVYLNDTSALLMGRHLRGAYWLTFLGPEFVAELGGQAKLCAQVGAGVEISAVGHGLMLRAGDLPEAGDVNHKFDLPLVRSVARALEPVTYFGGNDIEALFDSEDTAQAWQRRHL